ncbi:MAG: wax ester/triacylglycerol synthase family O-acyltransferase [Marmoricola sp.]|nr:wax ester/triacylglycerol synthase family O-acyltransferase [Marmoricola sp.]
MKRLSGLDASFLYLESSAQLMHVCGILVLDPSTVPGEYSFPEMKTVLEARVATIPDFRRKLKEVPLEIDHPVWIDDVDFDIDRHVHRLAVPAPGGPAELREVCGHLAGIPLDRSRPLWEMWVIEGLASGKIAVFTKMHHASVDGVSGSNLVSFLCSLEPNAPLLDLAEKGESAGTAPGDWELFGRGMLNNLAKPMKAFRLVGPTASLVTKTIGRARSGTAMAAPLTAPRTSFNSNIGGRRTIGYADISLDRIKEIRHAVEGATVNDVVLAISGGALRRYLEQHGELPESSLLASVPVSVHQTSTRSEGTNKVSTLFAKLGTDIADPVERLRQLAADNANAKEHHKAIPADTLQDWAEFAAPRTFGLAVRAVAKLRLADKGPVIHNLVISNVPGPPVPLYFVGARIDGFYPLGPIFHGAGLNVTVMSTNGRMHVGLIGCRDAMADIQDLADDFPAELDALYAAVLG